jgi:thiosulfate/3-mercaptopyruvate sulfurtransferase
MMRAFGHTAVSVLDGGMDKWRGEGRPLESGPVTPDPEHFVARLDQALVNSLEQVEEHLKSGDAQVVDARSAGRFAGTDPEPRAGLPSGRMAGSLNVPFPTLIDAESHTLLPTDVLREKFTQAGVDLSKPIVTSCGSGVTACLLAFALHQLGVSRVPIFDGSWTEWASRPNAPIARD